MGLVTRCLKYFLILFIFTTFVPPTQAENPENRTSISLITVRGIIDTIKNKPNLEEPLRLRILQAYYASEDNLEEQLMLEQAIDNFQIQLKKLPAEIKQLEKNIAVLEKKLINKKKEKFSLYPNDELGQRLIIEKSNFNKLNSSIRKLEIELDEQLKRPQQIREQIAEIKNAQSNTLQEQVTLAKLLQNKQEFDAHQTMLDSRLRKLNAILTKLDLENIVYPLLIKEKQLNQQMLDLQSKQLTGLIDDIDDFLVERTQQEIELAQTSLIQANKDAAGKHPVIRSITRENIRYNLLLKDINTKLDQYIKQKIEIEKKHAQLDKDFQSAEQKINLAGLSPTLGNLLREQRRKLAFQKGYETILEEIQKEISLTSLNLFRLSEAQKSLVDIDQTLLSIMSKSVSNDSDKKVKLKIRTELRMLLNDQKDIVFKLSSVFSGYSRTLADVDFALQQLIILGSKYSKYLDERLLWVPSAPMVNMNYVMEIYNSMQWFINLSHWQQVVNDIQQGVQNSPVMFFFGITFLALLLWFRKKIKLALQELLDNSSKLYADRFHYTFYSLGYAFLLSLPIPLFFAWLGWLLLRNQPTGYFSQSIANGLFGIILPLLIILFFYRLFKREGIVQTLFYWQEHSVNLIYNQLKWIRFVLVPAYFIISMFADGTNYEHSYTLGRMALIFLLLAFAFMFHRFAHPFDGLAKDYYREFPGSWISRFQYIWHGMLVLIPLIIIGFAITGYYQSALELQNKLVIILRLTFFSVLLHEIIKHWMALTNRKLALQNARQKRQQQELAKDKEAVTTSISTEEELLDIPKINEQSQKLLKALVVVIFLVGSWLTLRDMIPAFSIFDQVVLWQHMTMVESKEVLQPITLINVLFCLLYLVLLMIFINNFGGLIDLLFAGQFRMSSGSRYALIHLTRYAVISITIITIANELGGSWSQVQWLVAAVSVGLGFGLQEIFANMVSGIILLFERPIRVGDTVTVGEVTGTVHRIQMRATTITDWDQKELIVPNKMFITDKLINWSLTDTMIRVVISVGIAYDSDENLARRILEQVVKETPLVLNEPEPTIYFMGFGDSSLDFSIRVFVQDLNNRLPVKDELHTRIMRAFKENNIEIPFPQRDLHIRTSVVS